MVTQVTDNITKPVHIKRFSDIYEIQILHCLCRRVKYENIYCRIIAPLNNPAFPLSYHFPHPSLCKVRGLRMYETLLKY